MFLIIAPLVAMYLTAYMVTYLWYEQGKQITCFAFGSQTELLSYIRRLNIIYRLVHFCLHHVQNPIENHFED